MVLRVCANYDHAIGAFLTDVPLWGIPRGLRACRPIAHWSEHSAGTASDGHLAAIDSHRQCVPRTIANTRDAPRTVRSETAMK
jgi:hypothetical protein